MRRTVKIWTSSQPGFGSARPILRIVTVLTILLGAAVPSFAQSEARALSASFRNAAKTMLPAAVTVRGLGGVAPFVPLPGFDGPDTPFPGRDGIPDSGGSGVVIDAAKGYILTNDHVVPNTPRIVVILADGRQRTVREVRRDPRSDLALLLIDPEGLTTQATWGDSEALDLADWVLAIGQPFGLPGTVTAGIVSGARRGFGPIGYDDLIQTSAAINPGSSGGPLINLDGELIGINVAIKTLSGGYEGVGFAVPSSRARRVANDLAELGRVRRAYLGVATEPQDLERVARGESPAGAVVTSVAPGSPASSAGILVGDVIREVGGVAVRSPGAVRSAVEFAPIGRDLAMSIGRGPNLLEITCKPAAADEGGPRPEARPLDR